MLCKNKKATGKIPVAFYLTILKGDYNRCGCSLLLSAFLLTKQRVCVQQDQRDNQTVNGQRLDKSKTDDHVDLNLT